MWMFWRYFCIHQYDFNSRLIKWCRTYHHRVRPTKAQSSCMMEKVRLFNKMKIRNGNFETFLCPNLRPLSWYTYEELIQGSNKVLNKFPIQSVWFSYFMIPLQGINPKIEGDFTSFRLSGCGVVRCPPALSSCASLRWPSPCSSTLSSRFESPK